MSQCLFLRILSTVEAYDPYFAQKQDVVGVLGLSFLQKMTVAMRMLAYGVAVDFVDDYGPVWYSLISAYFSFQLNLSYFDVFGLAYSL